MNCSSLTCLWLLINSCFEICLSIPKCQWINGKRTCDNDPPSPPKTRMNQSKNRDSKQQVHQQIQSKQYHQNLRKPIVPKFDCEKSENELIRDLEIAVAASKSSDANVVRTIHLVYVHIHGHIDHYYHFLHDALLTFYPLYTSFVDQGKNPTVSKVVLWNKASYGISFTPVFEMVYHVKVSQVPCPCKEGSCAEITTDTSLGGSASLDSAGVLHGLYPFYFDDAIKFVQQRVLGNSKQQSNSGVDKKGSIILIERKSTSQTKSSRSSNRNDPSNNNTIDHFVKPAVPTHGRDFAGGWIGEISKSRERERRLRRKRIRRLSSIEQAEFEDVPSVEGPAPLRVVGISNHKELKQGLIDRFGEDRVVNVMLEDMSFAQQVALFTNAQVIVAQHGAGLANILFCMPSSLVVEICPRLHIMYQHLAQHRRMAYSYQDSCGHDSHFPKANVKHIVDVVDAHLKSSNWEG